MEKYYTISLSLLLFLSQLFSQETETIIPIGYDLTSGQQKVFQVGKSSLYNVESQSKIELKEDWLTDAVTGTTNWTTYTSGPASNVVISRVYVDTSHFGIVELRTGVNASGRACITQGAGNIMLGAGETIYETLFYIENLSEVGQEYILWIGVGDNVTASLESSSGMYLEYNRAVDTNWIIVTANSGIREKNTTTIPVVYGEWAKLKMILKSDNSGVEFFINGAKVGENATNLPINQLVSTFARLKKITGTTSRSLFIDYMNMSTFLNTTR